MGNLNLPTEAIQVIEETSSSPEEMQETLRVVDECRSLCNSKYYKELEIGDRYSNLPILTSCSIQLCRNVYQRCGHF